MTNKYMFMAAALSVALNCSGKVTITGGTDEDQECFVIRTESATYYYQKDAGGFSSIHDRDGVDWIHYNRSPGESYPASAASDFRGLPNMVYRSDDSGAGHPGFDKCRTVKVDDTTIRTVSRSGLWQWSWKFTDKDAVMTVEKTDPGHAYWFLYEGPIAGRFDPANQYWGNSSGGPIFSFQDFVKQGGGVYGQWDWAYFGDTTVDRVFFLQQLDPDDLPDTMGYMGCTSDGLDSLDGMVVFGFGREKRARPVMTRVPARFRIGFVDRKIDTGDAHREIAMVIGKDRH